MFRPRRLGGAHAWRLAAVALILAVSGTHSGPVRATAPADPCVGGTYMGSDRGRAVCVHDSHPAPAGVSTKQRPSSHELRRRRYGGATPAPYDSSSGATTAAASGSVACIGDGTSGNRVQALYVRASTTASRYADVVPLIRGYAADADAAINESAGRRGEGRRVRFVTDGSCALSVPEVVLSSAGDDTFPNMVNELRSKGYDRLDRKYLVWMDAAVGICGLGQVYVDDRPGGDNRNNLGAMFARVDAPCWGYAETHELLHTLGGVQGSAPHSTEGLHCWDEADVMCYADAKGVTMQNICSSATANHVDCNNDDYFDARPPAGSYLDTHWNIASSSFLAASAAPPEPPSITASIPSGVYPGNLVNVASRPSVPDGRSYSVRWTTSRSDCGFTRTTTTWSGLYCRATSTGTVLVTVTVRDSAGMSASAGRSVRIVTPSWPRKTSLQRWVSSTTVKRGRYVWLSGRLADAYNGRSVIGMPVAVYALPSGATRYTRIATRVTDINGRIRLAVYPRVRTTYVLISYRNATWKTARSWNATVRVR